jgi:hypothetical protein
MIFHGSQSSLEYDFVVSPGADPNHIELKFTGASSLKLEGGGDLIVTTAGGLSLTQHAPVLYQEEDGVRRQVAGSYIIRGKNRVGFRVGAYVRSRTLVIDPVVGYSARFGGQTSGYPFSIAVDAAGNAYVTGSTAEMPNLPLLPGSFQSNSNAQSPAFVYKLNSTGTDFVYTTLIGGSSGQYGSAVAVDTDGNVYVTGSTGSADFPVTPGAFQTTLSSTSGHVFVLKLNAAGNALLYATFIGGNYPDTPNAIAIDATGNAYITGTTESSTFPVTPGAFESSIGANSAGDTFVTKLNSTGTALVYSTYLGGQAGNSIAVDSNGNAYIAGITWPWLTFTVTPGAFQTTGGEGFVTKLDPTGSSLVYSTFFDSGTGNSPSGIAVDAAGNAYVAGNGGAGILGAPVQFGPQNHVYVAKLNPAGSALSYLTSVGGSVAEQSTGMALDAAGNVYVTGWSESFDFPLLSPVQTFGPPADEGFKTAIVFKLDPTGNLAYSTYFGSDYDTASAIAVDSNSNAYITGAALSTLFPVTPGAIDQESDGDIFVAQLSSTQACSFTFSSTSVQETIAGGDYIMAVTAPSGCNWIALSDQPWMTVTSASAGAGSGAVFYSVQPNPSPARTATLSIGGTPISVSQPNGCVYSLSTNLLRIAPSGGTFTELLELSTGSGCLYTISNVPAWMSIFGESPDGGSTSLGLQFSSNVGAPPRSALMTIAGLPFAVDQGGAADCLFSIHPNSIASPPSGSSGSFTVGTASECYWAAASDSAWLQATSLESSLGANSIVGAGDGTVYFSATGNATNSPRSGTLTIGNKTFTVTQSAGPPADDVAAGPVTPGSGSGSSQAFTFTFTDNYGYNDLSVVNLLINNSLDGIGACYVAFAPNSSGSGYLYLVDDAGDGGYTSGSPMFLPSSGSLQNSQCTINLAESWASASESTLTMRLAVTFASGFSGNHIVYLAARSNIHNSGWQALATWDVPGPAAVGPAVGGVNPARSPPAVQNYSFTFTDTNGFADLAVVDVLINSSLNGIGACYLAFVPTGAASGSLYLVDDGGDAGGPFVGGFVLGTSGASASNSQCSISADGSSLSAAGNTLILNLAISFSSTFTGNQVFYLAARNNSTGNSGWQALGSVTVP